jgi:hypothetical protein
MLMVLSGSNWGWSSDFLWKVYQTSLLSGATYAGGGWLPWLSATSVEMLDRAQNRNFRIITGQLASNPNRRTEGGSEIPILWLPSRLSSRHCTGKVA